MGAGSILKTAVEEYLDYDDAGDCRTEFHDGEIFRIDDVSFEHGALELNAGAALLERLKGGPCQATAGARVRVSTGSIVRPDLAVFCGPRQYADNGRTLTNPSVIVEILSPTTKDYDFGGKFERYRGVDSLNEYILLAQDRACVDVFRRTPANDWLFSSYVGIEKLLPVRSLDFEIPLAEIYRGIEFTGDA